MTDHENDLELRQFYEKAELPEDIVRRLEELESINAGLSPSARAARGSVGSWFHISSMKSLLLAAASVLLAFTAGYLTRQNLHDSEETKPLITKTTVPALGNTVISNPILPRIVAVRYHSDWCSRCPKIAPIYLDLIEEYGDSSLLFLTLDISSKNKSNQSRQMMKLLDIEWIENPNLETGSILLIDREKNEILAVVKRMSEQLTFEAALTDYLSGVK